jgi:threonine dehydrogenase-like Zn-dependent dehydrogenase
VHSALRVDHLGAGYQHLLGIAAAQRTGAAERLLVDDRDAPARLADTHGRDHCGGPRADDEKIEVQWRLLSHTTQLEGLQVPAAFDFMRAVSARRPFLISAFFEMN